jgi:hypothetical protein
MIDFVYLDYMIVGHTKFSPNRYFGNVKVDYNKSDLYSFDDVTKLY